MGDQTIKNRITNYRRNQNIVSPQRTILLLDALDEDKDAWLNFYSRTTQLLRATKNFRKVIITCRTQFFPREHEEDGRIPGQIHLSGFHCSKLFLSPFSNEQVEDYIKTRFTISEEAKKASRIVGKMNSLKFRPMLLSYIDFLIDKESDFNSPYSIYESLIEEWLNREMRKKILRIKKFCEKPASI